MKRIYTAVRALMAELPLGHYLLSSIFCIVMLLIHFVETGPDSSVHPSALEQEFLIIPQFGAYFFIFVTALFSATVLGIDFLTRELKDPNRAARLLTLPISPTERTLTLGTMTWLVIPALSIIPPYLILALLSLFGGGSVLAPAPQHFLLAVPISWATVILLSSLWLFPSLVMPKRGAILFLMALSLIVVYAIMTRGDMSDLVTLKITESPFTERDVIGLGTFNVLGGAEPKEQYGFALPFQFGWSGILAVLSILMMYAVAFIASFRKTA